MPHSGCERIPAINNIQNNTKNKIAILAILFFVNNYKFYNCDVAAVWATWVTVETGAAITAVEGVILLLRIHALNS